MKHQPFIFLLLVSLLANHGSAFGQKIYISPAGTDTNDGTIDKPLATLTAANKKARELRKTMKCDEPLGVIAGGGE